MYGLNDLSRVAHDTAALKGFHEKTPVFGVPGEDARHILSWLALIHTEVSEAAEEVRKGTVEGFTEELADVLIRVFDVCGALKLDLDGAVEAKMQKSLLRPVKHGGKLV